MTMRKSKMALGRRPTAAREIGDARLLDLSAKIAAADRAGEAAYALLTPAEEAFKSKSTPRPIEPRAPRPELDSDFDRQVRLMVNEWAEARKKDPKTLAFKAEVRRWQKQCSALAIRCGLRDAERRCEEVEDRLLALKGKVAAVKATTLHGLIVKATIAATHYPKEYDHDIMTSIVTDLLEMQKRVTASDR
jgi:hypothetical protein